MSPLTRDDLTAIEQLHARWTALEIAGDTHALLMLCTPDLELRPPSAQPICGRDAVHVYLAGSTARIHSIDLADRVIQGSASAASLTARFTTTFSTPEDPAPRQISGHHQWLLIKGAICWLITTISWSLQDT